MSSDFYPSLLQEKLQTTAYDLSIHSIGGGCINETVLVEVNKRQFFVKTNPDQSLDFFEKEQQGLQLLRQKVQGLVIPEVYFVGEHQGIPTFVMEYVLPSTKGKNEVFFDNLGRGLAELHLHAQSTFGLEVNNYIGALPQSNRQHSTWLDFFMEERLFRQFQLAVKKGFLAESTLLKVSGLSKVLEGVFPDENPALLHGDLWSGNCMPTNGQKACLYDPAVYYGHREMELAFTKLFGGFSERFYEAYGEVFPIASGFEGRVAIYNLYPLMVHVNLFGMGYYREVEETLNRFV
ncbi:fructosamine kinase family protein [Algivirga pacifica]|uniref:Fructosamine kinase family protein n=1 Tax=Algivirga pacifica TaxID=1162670 RepID=A0ABP9D5Z6_9BACT